jgi:hypothetical protein
MSVPKVRKKPTAREIASAIIEMNERLTQVGNYTNHVDRIFGLYLDFKGERKEFENYVNELIKKENKANDEKKDGSPDKKDLPKDTKNKRRRTKGIRKKSK